ncbi:MFS transporter [Asticcacaulis sp. EMRT-3]|uniref:MFS transporter n=1 Tax=Asticcacaulis sp. EMRT-3 TaxID=3040349 RepID=UPI0024AF5034|nr:MFS transporter [Asticcacaulis sp. EMRT-3]MDI7773844.1 MFS transporter [Asticcacaulis sp. EMRT-3]
MSKLKPSSASSQDADSTKETASRTEEPPAPPFDTRNERTFFRGRLLHQVRQFLNENGSLAAMFAVVFVNLVGFGIVVPLIPFFAQSLHAQAWQVTLMFTAYSLGQFFAEPFCGRLSDRIGRKPILLVTTALSVLFYCGLAFSPNIWVAIFVRFLCGLASGNISTIQGYVSDFSKPEQRASRMSMIGAAFSLGFIVGPVIGGLLTHEHFGHNAFRLPLFAAAVMSAVATLGVMLYVKESRQRTAQAAPPENMLKTAQEALKSRAIVRVILATLCYMMAFAGLESTFGLWVEVRYNWHATQIGAVFLFIGITAALMQMVFMRPLVRRYGESKVLAGGLFVFGLSFILQSLNHISWLIVPLLMLGTVGQAVIFSSICAIISLATSPDRQGAMLGLNMSTGAVARIIGPVVAGFLFSQFGPEAPLWLDAAMTIPAALLALQVGKVKR